jgi:hypothetical protein
MGDGPARSVPAAMRRGQSFGLSACLRLVGRGVSRVWSAALYAAKALLGIGNPVAQIEDPTAARSWGWLPALTANASVALYLAAVVANASRLGADWAISAFYSCIALLFLPIATRLIWPAVSRRERIGLLLVLTEALFIIRVLRGPIFLVDHDEFLHWITADDILEFGRLFTPNSLLPVGPLFPGLQLVTTALVNLTGLSVFAAGLIMLAIARPVFTAALFFFYEKVSGSPRVASIACAIYMGCSTFVFFGSHFAYESLAVVFLGLALLASARAAESERYWGRYVGGLIIPFFAALSVTHHMTAYCGGGLLFGLAALELIKGASRRSVARAFAVAIAAILLPYGWSKLMGNPGSGYLGPLLAGGLHEVLNYFNAPPGRKLFTGDDGVVAPLWQRVVTLGSVALIALGLSTSFFRALARADMPIALGRMPTTLRSLLTWRNSSLVMLTLITFGYPMSIVFRLTKAGWEIGNRIGPYSFLGAGMVIAIGIASFWHGRSRSLVRASLLGVVCTVILIGGIISSEGPRVLIPGDFRVSADSASIEPMGISAAEWTKERLGAHNRFAADRINRLLLATFGRQQVSSTLQHGLDAGIALVAGNLGAEQLDVLKKIRIEYLLADLRLTTGLPVVGAYFDGSVADQLYESPPLPAAFLKFNRMETVSRPFDNGYIVIYDVRTLSEQP